MTPTGEEFLACPACGARHAKRERFCSRCGLPLTYRGEVDAEQPVDEARRHARKIKPQLAQGELRQVATARQQPEAELIQMMLLEEGIPSTTRRATWDVPEMLPAGPRAILVPESGYSKALEVLSKTEFDVRREEQEMRDSAPSPLLLLAAIVGASIVVALLILLASQGS